MNMYNSTASMPAAGNPGKTQYSFGKAGNRLAQQGVPLLVTTVQVSLGLLLLYSCLSKFAHYHTFLSNVYSYKLLSPRMGILTAVTVPWVEFIVGIALLGGVARAGAFLGAGLLMQVFLTAQLWALVSGLNISCGCFGAADDTPISWLTAARTGGLAMACLACYVWELRRNSPS